MLTILLISTLAVVGADPQYMPSGDHYRHAKYQYAPKQQTEPLIYEDLIHQYNQKHGIEQIKPQWQYIPLKSDQGEEEEKPVNVEHFIPNYKAGWHHITPPPVHKEKYHHTEPAKEHNPLSNLKHSQQGGHEKIIENNRRKPDTPKESHKDDHQRHVLIKPQHHVHYEVLEKEHNIHHEEHKKEEEKLIHSPHHKDSHKPIILARPHVPRQHHVQQVIDEKLLEHYGRILENQEHVQQHKNSHKPYQHQVQQPGYGSLADEYKALYDSPEQNQQHTPGDYFHALSESQLQHHHQEGNERLKVPEHGQYLKEVHHYSHKPHQPHLPHEHKHYEHHDQYGVRNKFTDESRRQFDNSEVIQRDKDSYQQHHLPSKPHQHHVQEVVHERVFDEYGRYFDSPHHDNHHYILASNKDMLIELNRLKELAKEGEHYIRPEFDNHKLRHHELINYLDQLLKKSIAHYDHNEKNEQNFHHKIHEQDIERNKHEHIGI